LGEREYRALTLALPGLCVQAVNQGLTTYDQLAEDFRTFREQITQAFAIACNEPKITDRRDALAQTHRVSTTSIAVLHTH
jgi:hypothetical protein